MNALISRTSIGLSPPTDHEAVGMSGRVQKGDELPLLPAS